MSEPGALAGLRILDLAGPAGNYCGKMFAELGADVVLVEPPSGLPLRHEEPFSLRGSGRALSLPFAAANTSKRSIVLDLESETGRDVFRDLARSADLVLETLPPGAMQAMGLGHSDLAALNPGIVTTSITPFGQDGPMAQVESDDLISMALGGMLYLGGYVDGPPVHAAQNQAFAAGNLFAAVGSMLALTAAELTGEGDHVDVSLQECVVMGMENAVQFWTLERTVRKRTGGRQRQAGAGVYRCRDGYVYMMAGGIGGNRFWGNLVSWLRERGTSGVDVLDDDRWGERSWVQSEQAKAQFASVVEPFFADRPKAELYREAQRWRVPLCPVSTVAEVLASAQLGYRGFFDDIDLGEAGTGRVPGAPYRLTATPWRRTGPPPRLGQHTDEVLVELGYDPDRIQKLRALEAVA